MELIFYALDSDPPELRPAPASRAWMDATPDSYAYRCLPLNIANAHGWDVLVPAAFRARWSGTDGQDAIGVEFEGAAQRSPVSHFGCGVLTFHVGYLVRTPPGMDLWVGGPANAPKDAIAPLTGVVETDWSPASFTMNWKFTRPDTWVAFAAGEPFCTVFPLPRGLVEDVRPVRRALAQAPAEADAHAAWSAARGKFLRELPEPGSAAAAQKWQKDYFRGTGAAGQGAVADAAPGHRTRLRLAEVEDAPPDADGPGPTFRLKPRD